MIGKGDGGVLTMMSAGIPRASGTPVIVIDIIGRWGKTLNAAGGSIGGSVQAVGIGWEADMKTAYQKIPALSKCK